MSNKTEKEKFIDELYEMLRIGYSKGFLKSAVFENNDKSTKDESRCENKATATWFD